MTFGDAVADYKQQRKNDPNIKPGTKEYDDYRIKALLESWPDLEKMDVSKITVSECRSWSEKNAKKASSSSHNHTVSILRRVFKIAIEAGARYDNPALAAKWVKEHTKKQIKLPESGQFEMLVKEIENSGSGFAKPSAELVQFLAYGGFRKSEAANITWADCDFKRGKIILRGDPVTGLKRRRAGEFREVPMISEMRKLLEQIQAKRPDEPQTEKVMRVSECKKSITTACKKLGIPRFTHHDLRHLFATAALKAAWIFQPSHAWAALAAETGKASGSDRFDDAPTFLNNQSHPWKKFPKCLFSTPEFRRLGIKEERSVWSGGRL